MEQSKLQKIADTINAIIQTDSVDAVPTPSNWRVKSAISFSLPESNSSHCWKVDSFDDTISIRKLINEKIEVREDDKLDVIRVKYFFLYYRI